MKRAGSKNFTDTESLLAIYYYNVIVQVLLQVIFFSHGEQMKWENSQFSANGYMSCIGKDVISGI